MTKLQDYSTTRMNCPCLGDADCAKCNPTPVNGRFTAYELVDGPGGSSFTVFVPIGDTVHVSEWYGYDFKRVRVMTVEAARREYRRLLDRGHVVSRDSMDVSANYSGIDVNAYRAKGGRS